MSARAIIAPLSFGDSSLPRINLTYTRPIPGATYDWAVNQMPVGPLAQWPSLVGGTTLQATGTSPVVAGSGKGKVVRFDGVGSRLQSQFTLAGAQTIVAVYRFVAPKALDTVHYGFAQSEAGTLGIPAGADNTRAVSGSTLLFPSPALVPDTNWHTSILSVAGDKSVLRIDNSETSGNLSAGTRDGLTLGFSGSAGSRAAIEYKRVAIIPGGTTPAQRDAIMAQMMSEYVS